jgi:hypothetical protein
MEASEVSYPISAFVFTALILYALYLRRLRRAQVQHG